MNITQHHSSVAITHEIVNLLELRGNIAAAIPDTQATEKALHYTLCSLKTNIIQPFIVCTIIIAVLYASWQRRRLLSENQPTGAA